jgi:deoxyribodipyrimidine photo-lyase
MQAAQRVQDNHALEYAIQLANQRDKPLLVMFSLTGDFPDANLRHYTFMLEGLRDVEKDLAKRRIPFVALCGSPDTNAIKLTRRADAVIVDEGYLRIQRQWRKKVAQAIDCPLLEVTTNLIVPVEQASDKENFSAGTLRPRITRQLAKYVVPLKPAKLKKTTFDLNIPGRIDLNDTKLLTRLKLDASVPPSAIFTGGAAEAKKRLKLFLETKLDRYPLDRNDPMLDCQSNLSPYLHFGHISPLTIALSVMAALTPPCRRGHCER